MPSKYLLQIADRETGLVLQMEPGRQLEKDLVDAIVRRIVTRAVEPCVEQISAKGVGLMRTTSHVEGDIRSGLHETLEPNIRAGIEEVIFELKAQVRPSDASL